RIRASGARNRTTLPSGTHSAAAMEPASMLVATKSRKKGIQPSAGRKRFQTQVSALANITPLCALQHGSAHKLSVAYGGGAAMRYWPSRSGPEYGTMRGTGYLFLVL